MEKNKILNFLYYLFTLSGCFISIYSCKPQLTGLATLFYPEDHYGNQFITYYPFWYAIPFFLIGVIFYYSNYLILKGSE